MVSLSGVRQVGKTFLCQSLPDVEYLDWEILEPLYADGYVGPLDIPARPRQFAPMTSAHLLNGG